MEAGKARKRPVVVDYVEMTEDNGAEVAKWCSGEWIEEAGVVAVPTMRGQLPAYPSDRIVRGTHEEVYPIRADVFPQIYDAEAGGPGMRLHSLEGRHAAVCDCGENMESVSIRTAVFRWALHAIEAHRDEL
jgi:hypothetical protein